MARLEDSLKLPRRHFMVQQLSKGLMVFGVFFLPSSNKIHRNKETGLGQVKRLCRGCSDTLQGVPSSYNQNISMPSSRAGGGGV